MTLPRPAELYLDELTMLLAPADPVDRIEIVAGVREHIEARLADMVDPSEADVRSVLSDLGSPDALARSSLDPDAAARATLPPPSTPTAPPHQTRNPLWERLAAPSTVVTLFLVATVPSAIIYGITAIATWNFGRPPEWEGSESGSPLGPLLPGTHEGYMMGASIVMLLAPVWLVAVILLWINRHWRIGTKLLATPLPLIIPALTYAWHAFDHAGLVGFIIGAVIVAVGFYLLARRGNHS